MNKDITRNTRIWFIFALAYLVVDYIRIQDIIPVFRHLKPGMLITLTLAFLFIIKGSIFRVDTKQTRLMCLFICLLILYIPFAKNNFFAWLAAKTMLIYMPFILSIIFCVQSIDRLKILILLMVGIMIFIAIYSLGHGGMGSGGHFADENDLSLFVNMWIPFCFYLFFIEKMWLKKIVYACGFLLGIMSVVNSFSRGGFVGLVAMFFVLWFFSTKKILTLTVVIIFAGFIYLFGGQEYREEMSTVVNTQEGTARERIKSWSSAWDMFLDNPLGVGGHNFLVRFPEYQGDRFSRGMWGRASHSLWFTLIPETGIFGVLIYILLLYYNIKDIFMIKHLTSLRENADALYLNYLSLSILASLAGFFASATFLSVLYYPHYWYMTTIIVVAANIVKMKILTTHKTNGQKASQHAGNNSIL